MPVNRLDLPSRHNEQHCEQLDELSYIKLFFILSLFAVNKQQLVGIKLYILKTQINDHKQNKTHRCFPKTQLTAQKAVQLL